MLPDRSLLIGQKIGENAKVKKVLSTHNVIARFARNVECDIFDDFQTLCSRRFFEQFDHQE